MSIPTQRENPKGFHARYVIQKILPSGNVVDIDEGSEYFVMRLDGGGSDPKHIDACRKAAVYYAELIKEHLPELSADLIKRYGSTDKNERV